MSETQMETWDGEDEGPNQTHEEYEREVQEMRRKEADSRRSQQEQDRQKTLELQAPIPEKRNRIQEWMDEKGIQAAPELSPAQRKQAIERMRTQSPFGLGGKKPSEYEDKNVIGLNWNW